MADSVPAVKLSHEVDDQVAEQLQNLNNAMIGTPQFWLILFVITVFALSGLWAYNHEKKKIDWVKREHELKKLLDKYRKDNG